MIIQYEVDGNWATTPCPFDETIGVKKTMVGSQNCIHCEHFIDVGRISKTVTCNHPNNKE